MKWSLHVSPLPLSGSSNPHCSLPYSSLSAESSNKPIQQWRVVSHFQYRPRGPVIHFLNNHLIDAVVEAFLLQGRQKRSNGEARKNVNFFPISRAEIQDVMACESLYLGDQTETVGKEERNK